MTIAIRNLGIFNSGTTPSYITRCQLSCFHSVSRGISDTMNVMCVSGRALMGPLKYRSLHVMFVFPYCFFIQLLYLAMFFAVIFLLCLLTCFLRCLHADENVFPLQTKANIFAWEYCQLLLIGRSYMFFCNAPIHTQSPDHIIISHIVSLFSIRLSDHLTLAFPGARVKELPT